MIPRLRLEEKWDDELKAGNPLATVSRLIPYIIIYLMGNTLVLVILRLTNDMNLNGSFGLFMVAVLIQGFALGIFAMFAGWGSPSPVAAARFLLLVCTPGYIFGGVLLPPDFFPTWVQIVTNIFPLKWLFLFMRDVLLRGTEFWDCAVENVPNCSHRLRRNQQKLSNLRQSHSERHNCNDGEIQQTAT